MRRMDELFLTKQLQRASYVNPLPSSFFFTILSFHTEKNCFRKQNWNQMFIFLSFVFCSHPERSITHIYAHGKVLASLTETKTLDDHLTVSFHTSHNRVQAPHLGSSQQTATRTWPIQYFYQRYQTSQTMAGERGGSSQTSVLAQEKLRGSLNDVILNLKNSTVWHVISFYGWAVFSLWLEV